MRIEAHPTVQEYRHQLSATKPEEAAEIKADWLKKIALDAGADDAGFVNIDRASMADYRQDLLYVMPDVQTVMAMVFKLNRSSLRTLAHSIADIEFKHVWMRAGEVTRKIVNRLESRGLQALNMPTGFPYEAGRWPGKMWLTTDKVFAVEAGLGYMGWNRLVLHPQFGAAVILSNILLASKVDQYDQPINFNPCLECGLCVAVCPVGAVSRDGQFSFVACYSHNYRERLGGFLNWVENIADSRNHTEYRRRISDAETISMWQNLSIGAQTRCDRCMAVCPAGRYAIGEYLNNRKDYTKRYLKKFKDLEEIIYVVKGSDAEQHVIAKFPFKKVKRISNGIRPNSAKMFLESLPLIFQHKQSEGLNAIFHFTFTGEEDLKGTVIIREKTVGVQEGHVDQADLQVTADSRTWIDFLAQEKNLVWAIITRKIRLKGSPKLLKAFAKCFPS
jgi:epoxyqueuosine reductase QueG/putative sterol carrier protein